MFDVCLIGLGEVGLPLAAVMAQAGLRCVGVDRDAELIRHIAQGCLERPGEPGLVGAVARALEAGTLQVSERPVPAHHYVLATSPDGPEALARLTASLVPLLQGQEVIVVESTCGPGWVDQGVAATLRQRGLQVGQGCFVAHAPERVMPGCALAEIRQLDRIVGAATPACGERARALYQRFSQGQVRVTGLEVAALAKLAENVYRAVNVALADELADLARRQGVDISEVLALANEHPRVDLHRPGLGAGGRCLPLALDLLADQGAPLISRARERNLGRPARAAAQVLDALAGVRDPQIALLGVTYKADVPDTRGGAARQMVRWWRERAPSGWGLRVHDPIARGWELTPRVSLAEALEGSHAAVIGAAHSVFGSLAPEDLEGVLAPRLLFDFVGGLGLHPWMRYGFSHHGPGLLVEP